VLTLLLAACCTSVLGFIGLVAVLTMPALSVRGWMVVVICIIVGVAIVVMQWRQAMAGFAISDGGVRVRTVFVTRVLPWSEISDFVAEEADPGPLEWLGRMSFWKWDDPGVLGMFIELHNGELIGTPIRLGPRPVMGNPRFGGPPGGQDEFLQVPQGQALLTALRQRLADQGPQHAASDTPSGQLRSTESATDKDRGGTTEIEPSDKGCLWYHRDRFDSGL